MPVNTSEANLETIIERTLTAPPGELGEPAPTYLAGQDVSMYANPGGYLKRAPGHYNRALCLDTELALRFVQASQPQTWDTYKKLFKADTEERFAGRLAQLVAKRGTLHVLRKGFRDSGCHFKLVYFRPHSRLNPEQLDRYQANLFSVIRQLRYRPEQDRRQPELDLVLFLNGLPIFTAELKNQFTGQNVADAVKQYRQDRDPRQPLFALGRCLAHFAVDNELVYVTTHLRGADTHFLPFNKGFNHGAGNPPVAPINGRFQTSYLWDEMWSRDSILNLIDQFVQMFDEVDDKGNKTGKKTLIFPRYHQLDAARRLVAHVRAHGPGQRYLVQHSAGSGKTMTISWLAHQLSSLYGDYDEPLFHSVIVITDRRVLDWQLQQAMRQFEQTRGVVENIDKTSRQLKKALEDGKHIIVTTLQKFPVISREISELAGQRFAVIVDEAHSSQSGASTQHLNRAITPKSLEEAEAMDAGELEDMEDVLNRDAELRRQLPHVSTFAFTATPKPKTLQLFGTPREDGSKAPFSLYPMRQAIEEEFIVDVLASYTTYNSYWNLRKTIEDDPRYDRQKATYLLKSFVGSHEEVIRQKVAIIVEHFAESVAHRINGQAKAMVVTRSRLHAVYFKLALDAYLQQQAYPFKSLVAFSGKVTDPKSGNDFTETGMNTAATGEYISEKATAETFKRHEFRFMVVANKFQTGFDQPLLHTMYVDKKLGGVNAVQTLSRLNRTHPGKEETMVLDFVNDAEAIQKAFEPYYEQTILSEETDPNVLYELQNEIEAFHFYTPEEVDAFVHAYYTGHNQDLGKLYALLKPVETRFEEASEEEQYDFRSKLRDFVRLYGFLAQIASFVETEWEKLFHFARFLLRVLPVSEERLPLEIQQNIDMAGYRLQPTFAGSVSLRRGQGTLDPVGRGLSAGPAVEELESLSRIIEELNRVFGIKIDEDAEAAIKQLQTKLEKDPGLEASLRVNPPSASRLTFDHVAQDLFDGLIESNFKFYKQVTDDAAVKQRFFDWLFEQYLTQASL